MSPPDFVFELGKKEGGFIFSSSSSSTLPPPLPPPSPLPSPSSSFYSSSSSSSFLCYATKVVFSSFCALACLPWAPSLPPPYTTLCYTHCLLAQPPARFQGTRPDSWLPRERRENLPNIPEVRHQGRKQMLHVVTRY